MLSQKQTGTALAVHEDELDSAVTGVKVGISIRNIVEELREESSSLKIDQDSMATITTILHEVTSWRSRHYALRAAGIRDLVDKEKITVEHVRGVEIVAGPLTKVWTMGELHIVLSKLQMGAGPVKLTWAESA